MGNVKVSVLGGFGAAVGGEPVPEAAWRLKKARELVKLLALAPGHQLHREQVMDVLWRDRDPAAAANNLHQAVYVARRALDRGAIEVRDEMLQLTADVEVDVDRFESAAADARRARTPAAYRLALSEYGGELLPENRYEDWTVERREELAALAAELAAYGSADADQPPPLPTDASSFVGRGRELAELKSLLAETRLLTLAGTGGVGKTRLALELARETVGRPTRMVRLWSSSPRSPTRDSSRTRSRRRSTSARCPGNRSSMRWSSTSRRARCSWSSTTASICFRRRPGSRTHSFAARRS